MYTTCGPDIGNAHTGEEHLSHGYSSASKASQPVEASSRTSVASKEGLPGAIWPGPSRRANGTRTVYARVTILWKRNGTVGGFLHAGYAVPHAQRGCWPNQWQPKERPGP